MNIKSFGWDLNISIRERKLVWNQSIEQDTEWPYVNRETIRFTFKYFRRDVAYGATDAETLLTIRDDFCKAKISYDRVTESFIFIYENVLRLDISMHYLMTV